MKLRVKCYFYGKHLELSWTHIKWIMKTILKINPKILNSNNPAAIRDCNQNWLQLKLNWNLFFKTEIYRFIRHLYFYQKFKGKRWTSFCLLNIPNRSINILFIKDIFCDVGWNLKIIEEKEKKIFWNLHFCIKYYFIHLFINLRLLNPSLDGICIYA